MVLKPHQITVYKSKSMESMHENFNAMFRVDVNQPFHIGFTHVNGFTRIYVVPDCVIKHGLLEAMDH